LFPPSNAVSKAFSLQGAGFSSPVSFVQSRKELHRDLDRPNEDALDKRQLFRYRSRYCEAVAGRGCWGQVMKLTKGPAASQQRL
jgi:hypothetical protein